MQGTLRGLCRSHRAVISVPGLRPDQRLVPCCRHRGLGSSRLASAAAASSAGPSVPQPQLQQQQQGPREDDDPIVQWVVLRRDLWGELGWPLGPVIAQACHASAAAVFSHLDDDDTRAYVAPEAIDHMHKVVLEVKGEAQLRNLSAKLEAAGVRHKLWVEQPEDYPTCLATKPYRRSAAGTHFRKLQLCKAALGGGANSGGGGGPS